jgi:hypothetical protein
VDGTVEDNGRPDPLAGTSPEVDACNGIPVERLSSGYDLRLGRILNLQIVQELKVVTV